MSTTASLIVRFSSENYAESIAKLQQLKALGIDVQANLAASAKRSAREQVNAHVMAYREQQRLQQDYLRAKDQHLRDIANAERVQSDARMARMRREAAEAKALAKQEADAAKQAAKGAKAAPVATGVGGLNTGAVNLASYLTIARQIYGTLQQVYGVMANITNEAAKWEKFERALTDIEGSSSIAKRSLDDLYELAKRPGIGLEQANQIYLQFRALGIEGEKAKRMIADFSNTVALSGGGAIEFERINYQLIQMISKGKVLEEDLRIMRNSMPRLTVLMREAFGATTAKDLRDRGVDATKFVEGILTQMEKLPTATQTLESRIENAATAWSRFKASLVDTELAGKGIDKITAALEGTTDVINGKAWQELLDTIRFLRDTDVTVEKKRRAAKSEYGIDIFEIKGSSYEQAGQSYAAYMNAEAQKEEEAATKKQEALAKKPKKPATKPEVVSTDYFSTTDLANYQYYYNRAREQNYAEQNARTGDVTEAAPKDDRKAQLAALDEKIKKQELVVAAAKKRVQALQELSEAERGEYAQRLAEISNWERDLTARLQANENERTRIFAVATRQRRELYASAYAGVLDNTSGFFGSMAALSKQQNESNTRDYAKWVAIQQSLAIASASMNIYVAMSKALSSGITTLDGLVQMGVVAAEGGKILSAITSMNAAKVGKGAFARGGELGYGEWGIAGEAGAEIVEGPSRIMSARDSSRMLSRGSGAQVNVHNYAGAAVSVQERDDGSLDIILNKAVELAENRMTTGVLQGSSKFGRALQSTYSLKRKGT